MPRHNSKIERDKIKISIKKKMFALNGWIYDRWNIPKMLLNCF